MSYRNRWVTWVLMIGMTLFLVAPSGEAQSESEVPDLLAHSQLITEDVSAGHYDWLSNTEAVFWRTSADEKADVVICDTNSRTSRQANKLNEQIDALNFAGLDRSVLSPDRSKFVIRTSAPRFLAAGDHWRAISIDGRTLCAGEVGGRFFPQAWTSDSTEWVTLHATGRKQQVGLHTTRQRVIVFFYNVHDGRMHYCGITLDDPDTGDFGLPTLKYITQDGMGVFIHEGKPDHLSMFESDIENKGRAFVHYDIAIPRNYVASESTISPDGTLLVTSVRERSPTTIKIPYAPYVNGEIRICRIDGTDNHAIARWTGPIDFTGSEHVDYPSSIKWLPDRRRISYVLHNKLYILPIQ